jgi:O-antigen/teichoic acid export membrane protein
MSIRSEQFKRGFAFGKFFLGLGTLGALGPVFGFVSMMIKFRYLGAELVGMLNYFVALSNLPPALYDNFSRLIGRFAPTASPRRRAELLLASFLCQAGILVAIAVLFGLAALMFEGARFWHGEGVDTRIAVFMATFVAIIVPITLVSSILTAYLNVQHRFYLTQGADVLMGFLNLIVTIFVVMTVTDLFQGIRIMISATLVSALCVLLIKAFVFWRSSGILDELKALKVSTWIPILKDVYSEHLKKYTLPMQLTGLFWYISEYFAVLIFARLGMMREAGIYGLVSRIFSVPRKFIPDLLGVIFPRMVLSRERDQGGFSSKYRLLTWGQLAAQAAMASVLLVAMPVIAGLVNLEVTREVVVLYLVFSLNLCLHALITANGNLILLSTDTRWYLLSSGLRAVVVTVLNLAFVPKFGAFGAAGALLISSMFVLGMFIFENRKAGVLLVSESLKQLGICLVAGSIWCGLLFVAGYL